MHFLLHPSNKYGFVLHNNFAVLIREHKELSVAEKVLSQEQTRLALKRNLLPEETIRWKFGLFH